MPEQFSTNKAKIQFLFPFKVDRWEAFGNGLNAFVDEQKEDLYPALLAALRRLELAFPCTLLVSDAKDLINAYLDGQKGRPNRRKSNASLLNEIRDLVRRLPTYAHELYLAGQDLCCLELNELIRLHETSGPENLMEFVSKKTNSGKLPLFKEAKYHAGDDKGTRGYLERKQPQIEVRLKAENLAIANPATLPDLSRKLPSHSSFRGRPGIRLVPTIVLMSTGFGCLKLKAHLANQQGLLELVNEIVFTADGPSNKSIATTLKKKVSLAEELQKAILGAVRRRSMSSIQAALQQYSTCLDTECIGNRLQKVVDEITLVRGELTANDIIDAENLDRGFVRGQEPQLLWKRCADNHSTLYDYFRYIVYDIYLANLSEALLQDEEIREFINRPEQRLLSRQGDNSFREQLVSSLPNLAFSNSSLTIEEHPYVSTFMSAPISFKSPGSREPSQVTQSFRAMIDRHRKDLSRILMKSKWADVRSDWEPATNSLENVFYSDLIHMAVHVRSTLCLYYTPASADEYRLIPELAQGYKYREELNDTLQSLRIIWYAYSVSDQLVTQDIKSISLALEVLKEKSLKEEFPEVIEGLADVIGGIDRRKVALAEIMEDPLSRKGGSSLFSEIVEKTSHAFHLQTLYQNLHNKIERLDMLGIHINENVQQYSGLLVQEGTRSTQLTLEFLEAFIIGVYVTELIHLSLGKKEVYPFDQWWAFGFVAIGSFLTALPLITLIRKGRSKFLLHNPMWLERLEELGKIVGPAFLLIVGYLAVARSLHPAGIVGLLGIYLATIPALRRIWDRVGNKLVVRLKEAIVRRKWKI